MNLLKITNRDACVCWLPPTLSRWVLGAYCRNNNSFLFELLSDSTLTLRYDGAFADFICAKLPPFYIQYRKLKNNLELNKLFDVLLKRYGLLCKDED